MLDIRTLVLSSTIMSLICISLMALLWLQNRNRFAGIGFWLAEFVVISVAIVLLALRGVVPDFLSIVVANGLIFYGMILLYTGLQWFVGKSGSQTHNYILLVVFTLVDAWFTYLHPSLRVRDINNSAALFIYAFQIAWFIFRQSGAALSFPMRIFGIIMVFFCLSSVVRIVMGLLVDPGTDLLKSGSVAWTFLAYQTLQVAATLSLFLQINHRLVVSLEDDILQRKQVEHALKASQRLAEELYESAPDALVTVNRQGRITHANSQTQVLSGYTPDELLNQPIEMLIPQHVQAKHEQNRQNFFARPRTRSMGIGQELSVVRKDGRQVPVEIKLSPLQTGEEVFVTATIRDISERIQREEHLQQAQAQVIEQQRTLAIFDERQRMARDLHDSVNQSIHSLVLFSETLTATLEKNNVDRATQISQYIQESARQAIKETRLLLYQAETPIEKDVNLLDELNARLANIELRAGVKAQVILEGSLEYCLSAWHENLFWIAIEALNNSLKHAQARNVQIILRCFPEKLELEVLDDGKGFDITRPNAGGYGLRNMQGRAMLLGGHLTVVSSPAQGTSIRFHIDIKV